MTPQELKNSILQLAIQGKLVEQRPEEGTAEDLYRQIQADKQRLIKAGTIKKDKPLPEITEDEKPFDIPEGWKWVRLGAVISLLSGQDMPPTQYNDIGNGLPYITGASNIEKGIVTVNRWTRSAKAIAKKGDLLLTCKGTVGKTAVLSEAAVHIARQIMAITAHVVETRYIMYFIDGQIRELKSQAKSMIPGIERNNVLLFLVPLPPLAEQKRIVAKIEELLPYIDRYEQAWSKLEEFNKRFPTAMQKSILQTAIQGKLVEQRPEEGTAEDLYRQMKDEKQKQIREGRISKSKSLVSVLKNDFLFEIPENWVWIKIGEIAAVVTKGTTPRGGNVSYLDRGIGFLRAENVAGYDKLEKSVLKYIDEETHKVFLKRSILHRSDILVTIAGTLGRTAIVREEDLPLNANQAVSIIRLASPEALNLLYLVYALNSPEIQKYLTGQKKITAIPNLTLEIIENCVIPLPPLAEQKRIVAKIEELLPLCDKIKSNVEKGGKRCS